MTTLDAPRTSLRSEEPVAEAPVAVARVRPQVRQAAGRVLITFALLVAWSLAYVFVLSRLDELHAQKSLYASFRSQLAQGLAPMQLPVAPGTPIALIDAPDAHLTHVVVVEGTSPGDLQKGPGHLSQSVLPGQQGTTVLLGRAVSYGGPFGHIADLQAGSVVTVTTNQGAFHYRVLDVRRRGDPVPAPPAATSSRLVLVTAESGSGFGALQPSNTLYVDADLVGGKAQPDAGAPSLVPSDERPMGADTSSVELTELVLGLALLTIVLLLVSWARARWSSTAAWVAGVPAVVASLWLVSDVAARLLPNLM